MKSYPALGGIVFWSTGIHYGIMQIWTNQGIHRSPIPCWLIIGLKSWHSHERPKDPKGIWKWWHLDISWRFGDEPNLEDISFGVYTVQDVDVTWISHIIVPHEQFCDLGILVTMRYLPQIFWQLGAVAPLCFVLCFARCVLIHFVWSFSSVWCLHALLANSTAVHLQDCTKAKR